MAQFPQLGGSVPCHQVPPRLRGAHLAGSTPGWLLPHSLQPARPGPALRSGHTRSQAPTRPRDSCRAPPVSSRADWRTGVERFDRHPRRPGAQPQERLPGTAAQPTDRVHRALRLGQVEPGLRHHLRRRPAPLRGEPVGLRAPVPRADGEARRRLHRGPVPGHLHRPEDGEPQPALHGGHRHRDPRLPAAALRPGGGAPLPAVRARGRPARPPSRSWTASWNCPRAPASRSWPRWCGGARASTRPCSRN